MFINDQYFNHQPAPTSIISTVPSITALLAYFQLDDKVPAITSFCVHPPHWHQHKKRIGGTKKLHVDAIIALQPQLIIANKEENVQSQIETLAQHCNVWLSDVNTFDEGLQMILSIGQLTHCQPQAHHLVTAIQKAFAENSVTNKPLTDAIYLIWKDPYMSIGGDTFINSMLQKAGFNNMLQQQQRYPELTIERLQQLAPPVVLLSSEPYPFKEKDIAALQPLLPQSKIILVDGEMFSWYGNHMLHAANYFKNLQDAL